MINLYKKEVYRQINLYRGGYYDRITRTRNIGNKTKQGDEKMRTEVLGITMTREEHEDSEGRIRLYWVLRNEAGWIELKTRTWEEMIQEMMFETVRANQ